MCKLSFYIGWDGAGNHGGSASVSCKYEIPDCYSGQNPAVPAAPVFPYHLHVFFTLVIFSFFSIFKTVCLLKVIDVITLKIMGRGRWR